MNDWILGIIGGILAAGFIPVMTWAVVVIKKDNKRRLDAIEKKLDKNCEHTALASKAIIIALDGLVQLGANGDVKKTRDKHIDYAIDN